MFHRFAGLRHAHFVGIGGAGMSGIAEVLLQYEVTVSGCDQSSSEATERLRSLGVAIATGHSIDHLQGVDLLVISSAIAAGNPEVAEAKRRGITVVRRAEMLAELMRMKYGIAVAGTHGKTTTTSLVGAIMTEAGLDPTVIVGGRLRVSGTGARLGNSDFMVVEADEFDRSFLSLFPILAVITSVDRDHLDTYHDVDAIRDAFVAFASRVPFFGQVIVCADDPNVAALLPRLADRRVTTYGLGEECLLRGEALEMSPDGTSLTVRHRTQGELGRLQLPLAGLHNVRNALAAVGASASSAAPRWWTTTRTIRPRSRQRSPPPARSSRVACCTPCFSPTSTRGPAIWPRISAGRCRRPTMSWSPTSIRRASDRSRVSRASSWRALRRRSGIRGWTIAPTGTPCRHSWPESMTATS